MFISGSLIVSGGTIAKRSFLHSWTHLHKSKQAPDAGNGNMICSMIWCDCAQLCGWCEAVNLRAITAGLDSRRRYTPIRMMRHALNQLYKSYKFKFYNNPTSNFDQSNNSKFLSIIARHTHSNHSILNQLHTNNVCSVHTGNKFIQLFRKRMIMWNKRCQPGRWQQHRWPICYRAIDPHKIVA